MVHFSPSIEQRKHFIIAKLTIWVWCSVAMYNEWTIVNKSLTHKAVGLCLANSQNNRETTTKYMGTLIASITLSITWCW